MKLSAATILAGLVALLPAASATASPETGAPAGTESAAKFCDTQFAASGAREKTQEPTFDAETARRDVARILKGLPFAAFAFLDEDCLPIKVGEKIRFDLHDGGKLWVTRTADLGDALMFDISQQTGDRSMPVWHLKLKFKGYQTTMSPTLSEGRTLVQVFTLRNP